MNNTENKAKPKLLLEQSKMFFIVGLGRSGTTLLQEIMNTFRGFCNLAEARIDPGETNLTLQWPMSCYAFIRKFNDFSYLEKFIKKNWTNEYFVEKTPNSILSLTQLSEKYPDANYIFLERNPIKILLSWMNYQPPGEWDDKKRQYDLEAGNIEKDELLLNYEQHRAKQVLKMVKEQVFKKPFFRNQITIRYEDLIKNLDSHLKLMGKKFDIQPDLKEAQKILSRPSPSSKNNKYDIKSISDPIAINMIKEACSLWNYEYNEFDA